MLLQVDISPTVWLIISIIIATILLWLMLYLASGWVISKAYSKEKKMILLITALIAVLLLPIVSSGAGWLLNGLGGLLVDLRDLIAPSGRNYLGQLVTIIVFLVFMIILKVVASMEWKDTVWIALIGLFLLYMLYSIFPELDFIGAI
jgi:hypothetical protein